MPEPSFRAITADLVAVLVAVTGSEPRVLTTRDAQGLPAGPFEQSHRSLQAGMRAWVEEQTHHPLGYVEQLYTFADHDRSDEQGVHAISISYLALTREIGEVADSGAGWQNWYRYFPWEDHRAGEPGLIPALLLPALANWAAASGHASRRAREQRIAITFGQAGHVWNEDMVLQRYELLYEAGLIPEVQRRSGKHPLVPGLPGTSMIHDHRRILATGIARLRAKIKYRPVMFELMPPGFTLLQLQQTVEALAGRNLHKQNFRRLIEQQNLVEETGEVQAGAAGRPAKLFRFRRDVLQERAIAGSKLPLARP